METATTVTGLEVVLLGLDKQLQISPDSAVSTLDSKTLPKSATRHPIFATVQLIDELASHHASLEGAAHLLVAVRPRI